jgi:intracellular multiplication protein IcmD
MVLSLLLLFWIGASLMNKKLVKKVVLSICALLAIGAVPAAFAVSGLGSIAANVTSNLGAFAKLITAGAYTAGLAFAVGAIVKFKAHKDNPTQIPIGMPIALLFVAAALIFIPSIFKSAGATLFGASGTAGSVSGLTSFTTTGK